MRAALVGAPVAAALLCGGQGGALAMVRLVAVSLAAASVYLAWIIARGYGDVPTRRLTLTACAAGTASALAAVLIAAGPSPMAAWLALGFGLALIPTISLLTAADRRGVDSWLSAAAWIVAVMALHQRLHGALHPVASFSDEHVFAGVILLLFPISRRAGGAFLPGALLLCLYWTHSYTAWLALGVATLLERRQWNPSLRAASEAAVVVAAFTLRGHNAFLSKEQWPLFLAWCAPVFGFVRRGDPALRAGPIALLIFGLRHDVVAVPVLFWLFCLSTAWSEPESKESFKIGLVAWAMGS